MKIKSFIKFYIILIALMFIFYSFYDLGLIREILLFLVITLISPSLFRAMLGVKGVRKGDLILASFSKQRDFGFFAQKVTATALSGGRKRDIIKVALNSGKAEGEIISCGGIFFPAEVKILYEVDDYPKDPRYIRP